MDSKHSKKEIFIATILLIFMAAASFLLILYLLFVLIVFIIVQKDSQILKNESNYVDGGCLTW